MSRLSDGLVYLADPAAQLTDIFTKIANKDILKSHVSTNKLPMVPWLNDTGKQAIKERKNAQINFFSTVLLLEMCWPLNN